MERFKNAIFKQREGINSRMTEMFGLLQELTTSRNPEKVLIREEAKFLITKNVNSISLTKGEEERSIKTEAEMKNEAKNGAGNKSIKTYENEEAMEAPGSQRVTYYLKHKINEKLIKGLVDNNIFNNSLSGTQVRKKKGKTYKVLPRGPVYEAILKKKITKKEEIRGNFEIPCSMGGLKQVNALADQGFDVNVMPYTTYMKFTNERPDIKENEKRPFILGTPFLTMAKAKSKFDKGTITLRSGKNKTSPRMVREDKTSSRKGDEV
ncbi:hypothetical protein Tco_0348943 [Tanacetum coccineum]